MTWRFDHMDANENVFFSRQLETIRAELVQIKYPELLMASGQIIPLSTGGMGPGDEVYTYRQFSQFGKAAWMHDGASDPPRVGVDGDEVSSRIKPFWTSYGWTRDEIRKAARANVPLQTQLAYAARRSIDEFLEDVGAVGDSSVGLYGLLNQPNALDYTSSLAEGDGGSKLVEQKTADEVLADLNTLAGYSESQTSELEQANTMLVPPSIFRDITTRRLGDGSDNTILKHFLANTPNITTVKKWVRLEAAGAGGSRRIVTYRNDPSTIVFLVPSAFEQEAPQQKGLRFDTIVTASTGGVICFYPKSITYCDRI